MPKGPKGEKRPAGIVECAYTVFQIATGERVEEKPSGRRHSGYAGAAARAKSLSSAERKEIAKKAASAKWNKSGESRNERGGPMTEKERLLGALFPAEEGSPKLINIKFLLRDPTITQEQLCKESANAIEKLRREEIVRSDKLDGHLRKN